MKKFKTSLLGTATLLLFLYAIQGTAQTVSTAYETEINTIFNGVDKTKVPHKLLLDYGMEFTNLLAYNGTLTNENKAHKGTLESIYNTLLMARVQTNVTGLLSPTAFNTNWNNLRSANTIVLSGLYYKYSVFKDNASPDFITINNNKLYDKYVNGVWQNPYENKQVFAVTAPILLFNELTMDVKLPSALWYTNQGANVQSIAIDFNNGQGYQTMTLNQAKTISYNQAGTYTWTYKLTLTNNQILYSHSKIKIEGTQPLPPTAQRTINEPCQLDQNNIDTIEFVGTQTYLGVANTATIEIRYRDDDCTDGITKPLIVAEGFESGLLGVENPLGENTYFGFIQEATSDTGNLPGELNDYDIIYVNWDQGRDYLQRNALLLEDIITWVNSEKTTTTENVVLGQNMGGVIARYALRDMEDKTNLDHDTSLYISHDAPHQGANVPISIQYFARHMIDQFVSTPLGDQNIPIGTGGPISIEDIESIFNAPGTQQLLDNNIDGGLGIDNTLHDAWQTELETKGYPEQTRNIAISNGNHCANTQVINPEDLLFSFNGEANPSTLTSILIEYIPFLNPLNDAAFVGLAIIFNEPAFLLGVLPGRSKLSFNFNCKALPNAGQTRQIYSGNITFTKRLLFVININLNITDRVRNNPATVNLSYDYYPGGFFPIPFDFEDVDISNAFFSANITASAADSFNFISTPSALDVGSGNANLLDSDYLRVYTTENPTGGVRTIPFDNYVTSLSDGITPNERHISFNTANGNWLALELNDIANDEDSFDCSFYCDDIELQGDDFICGSSTYSPPLDADTATWTVTSGANLVTTTTTGLDFTITQANSNNNGYITLEVTYGNDKCGNVTLTKDIWVGTPNVTNYEIYGGDDNVPINSISQLNVDYAEGNTGYYWFITTVHSSCPSGGTQPMFQTGTGTAPTLTTTEPHHRYAFINWGNCTGEYVINCRAINPCGTQDISYKVVDVYKPNGNGDPCLENRQASKEKMKVYPNPVKGSTLHLRIPDPGEPCDPTEARQSTTNLVKIYDFSGRELYSQVFETNDITIEKLDFKKGHYVLNVFMYNGEERKQMLVIE